MLKAFKYQIYPNQEQKALLAKHFGCARWAYNYGLGEKIKAYEKKEKVNCFDIINNIVLMKKSQEFSWLNEVNSQCLQMAARNLDNAFQRFFKDYSMLFLNFINFKIFLFKK
jgi:putative transposase